MLRRQGYSKEVDLWSLGVITYILLCGYPPFFDQKNAELFKKIMAGKYQFDHPWWDHISERGIYYIFIVSQGFCSKAIGSRYHKAIYC